LDISEFNNIIRIDIDPSSLAYSEDLVAKTVYVDDPNVSDYVISFTNDNTYLPSQADINLQRQRINIVSSEIGGRAGGTLGVLGNYLIDKKQEKDVQKKTLAVYELKINTIPDEKQGLKCIGRMYIREITSTKDQILLDSVFVSKFRKVHNEYKNAITFTKEELSAISSNLSKDADKTLSTHPDIKISGLYNDGKSLKAKGKSMATIGGGVFLGGALGLCLCAVALGDSSDESIDSKMWPFYLSTGVMFGGCGLYLASLPITSRGKNKIKKAVSIYNESLEKERANLSKIKVGFTGNGVGLAFTF
jgi:hypothetical protein